ncbi:MAG: Rne/Rng family ribonuclease [Acidobacteriaceae bacterium]|nr:Rne/Rng family ribonuclease [Acidobacteriaceae bacterium]
MSKELVIGSNRHETKVAILEDDQLVEIYFQRANEYSLAGSIHKGRVTRVLPGMQSAFVDLGLERDTFLYVSDFFEEHEDIDTVSDEKPVRRERSQNRPPERPPQPVVESSPAERESDLRAADLPESESTATAGVTAAGEPSEVRTGERPPEGDRGFRDRRGRRSRRRRQRGRGFPENKYAQPVSPQQSSQAEAQEGDGEESEEAGEVIVLPGESLAKYRHVSAPETVSGSEPPEPKIVQEEEPAAVQEEIAAEAEELELADKVFSHHEDDSVMEEEQKIEQVKQDTDAPIPEEPPLNNVVPIRTETEQLSGLEEIAEHEPDELVEQEPDELELEAADEGVPPVDEALEDNALPIADPGHPDETAEQSQTQTASVREQGGHYMHRVSRRMRRRRGGNRFHHQQREFSAEPTGAGTGTAAAAAVEPEARMSDVKRENYEERSGEKPERVYPSISDLLKAGQEIIVQIAKEPLGQKGARITSHIALPGRYVVFMPSVNHLGVSRKVSSDEERQRLKRILQTHREGTTGGFIVRTAGEGVSESEIAADMNSLYSLWLDIRQKAEKRPAPALLHHDLEIVERILRDQVTDDFKAIWVDNEEMYEDVVIFMQRFQPGLVNRVKMYTRSAPIFDAFNITQELERALRPKVWLKSGGYIVINQTEALVAIDINTGKYVGKSNRLEDTIVKTNIEAVKEIVRQIRLRDLGGIIVVDFIDMDERKNRQKVMQALEDAMRADKAPYKILQFNDFGLVAITRKRVKQSLERTLCAPCPYCEAAGYVKSVQTVVSEILVEAQKISKAIEGKDVMLRVHPDVAKVLKASDNQYLEELEEILGRPVLVTGDPTLHHEKFDLA